MVYPIAGASHTGKTLQARRLDPEKLILGNRENLGLCREIGCKYALIEDEYPTNWDPFAE